LRPAPARATSWGLGHLASLRCRASMNAAVCTASALVSRACLRRHVEMGCVSPVVLEWTDGKVSSFRSLCCEIKYGETGRILFHDEPTCCHLTPARRR
jgi:hypothetical protein